MVPAMPNAAADAGGQARGDPREPDPVDLHVFPDNDDEAEATPRTHAVPIPPSPAERENHYLTGHAQYRSWCPHCVRTRGRSDVHPHLRPAHHWPELAFDYAYLSSRTEAEDEAADADGQSPLVVMRDGHGRGIFP